MSMLSETLELTLKKALSIANHHHHEYATYEHLLLAIIDDEDVKPIFIENNVATKQLVYLLSKYLQDELVNLVHQNTQDTKPTAGFQRIIQRAAMHGHASGQKFITGAHVLAEFFFEQDSYALACLKEANLHRNDVLKYIKKQNSHPGLLASKPKAKQPENSPVNNQSSDIVQDSRTRDLLEAVRKTREAIAEKSNNSQDELEKYCVNLNDRASQDGIDCLIGRQNEIQRTIEILCRRKKNNAILVGEPGVGKTAIAEGLAIRIINKDVPDILKDTVIYSLDVGSLVAGTKFRGDFEERIKSLLQILKVRKNVILFIDEIHTIIGAGSTTTGALDASNLLKPALASGDLRCIGSTTFKEFHNHFEKDMALVRRFQKVVVSEPNEENTMTILQGLKSYYEKHHNVSYSDSALKAAITLSERYINDRHLPDKAIDLMDEAGARSKTLNQNPSDKKSIITEKDIESLITSILNIPNLSVATNDIKQLKELKGKLKSSIFGQDEAIDSLCSSIKLSRAGLKQGSKPIGCYLFVGSTGVGKTELAKQLAILCNMKLLKFDMSEFAETSSISKLLGSAPGYAGFDQGGMLTQEVGKHPYSVVLFDEIEKANSEIFNLLLQIMDEGSLTDSSGKNVNFSHSIIILTSNLCNTTEKNSIGFASDSQAELKEGLSTLNMEAINNYFSPEFRGRLDKIILFNPVDKIIDKIVSKNIKDLASMLADKKIRLHVTPSVKKYFVDNYYNRENGARGLDKAIDTQIKQRVADEILFGKLKNGGTIDIDYSPKTKNLFFTFTKISQSTSTEEVETT